MFLKHNLQQTVSLTQVSSGKRAMNAGRNWAKMFGWSSNAEESILTLIGINFQKYPFTKLRLFFFNTSARIMMFALHFAVNIVGPTDEIDRSYIYSG